MDSLMFMKRTCRNYFWSAALAVLLPTVASHAQTNSTTDYAAREAAPGVWQVGNIAPLAITESSGLVPCRGNTNAFWTHNDGRRRTLYAITRTGQPIAEFFVDAPSVADWEDIARDDTGNLYLADIGNNDARRTRLVVHQFAEPDPQKPGTAVIVTRSWDLTFPGKPFDCESLFIWKEHGYVISKVFKDEQAEIYRFPLTATKEPVQLELVAKLPVTSPVTGADVSPDGQMLGLVCKSGAYLFRIDGDVARAATAAPLRVKFREGQLEGCCFVPEGLLATSEQREMFLFGTKAFRDASK